MKSIVMGSFVSQKPTWPSLLSAVPGTFSLPESQYIFTPWPVFPTCACCGKPHLAYLKEQTEYIQNQIDKIRDSVEDRQSRIAWQRKNEVSRRKSTAKTKLKTTNQQERIHLWKQHFENLLGNPPKVTHEPITKIVSKQLEIKLGPFIQEELDSVLRKIKNRKAAGPDEVWKTR